MKRLLSTTTVLSLVLAPVQPWPLMAQGIELTVAEDGSILMPDGTVLCTPTEEQPCDLNALAEEMSGGLGGGGLFGDDAARAAEEAAQAEAEAAAARAAEEAAQAEAAAAAQAAAQAEADAAAARAAEEAAQAEADAAARAAEEAAQAEADAAARAAEEAAQAEADAAAARAAEEAAQAEADAAARAAEEAAQAEADAAARAAEEAAQAEADAAARAAEEAAQAEADAAARAATEAAQEPAGETGGLFAPAVEPAQTDTPAEPEAAPPAETAAEPAAEGLFGTPVAETLPQEPVDAPVVTEEEAQSLFELLAPPVQDTADGTAVAPAAAAAAAAIFGTPPADGAAPAEGTGTPAPAVEPESVTTTTVTEDTTRSSDEEFAAAPTAVGDNKRSGLSDLEKVGLLALGALVVGAVLSDGREVVENTGDRVVVRDRDGNYAVYKDDDTLLRRPGSTVRTESWSDGSTRTTVDRDDGTQVVTIRDASGRVLRRATYDSRGNEVILIDDLAPEEVIDVTTLPPPRADRVTISSRDEDAALKTALAREEARLLGRSFSLRQIREIPQVRALAATIDVDNITFDSGSAVIRPTEARKLADIGRIMDDILAENPNEVFLIEGHTDAVGGASNNLTLSDRRAESVALALTEYFGIPPENLVVQGYGESELRIDTQRDERLNRRAVLRVITPLMRTADLR